MERSKADYTVGNRYITEEMYVTEKYSILCIPRYITRKLIASRPIEGNNAAPSG